MSKASRNKRNKVWEKRIYFKSDDDSADAESCIKLPMIHSLHSEWTVTDVSGMECRHKIASD